MARARERVRLLTRQVVAAAVEISGAAVRRAGRVDFALGDVRRGLRRMVIAHRLLRTNSFILDDENTQEQTSDLRPLVDGFSGRPNCFSTARGDRLTAILCQNDSLNFACGSVSWVLADDRPILLETVRCCTSTSRATETRLDLALDFQGTVVFREESGAALLTILFGQTYRSRADRRADRHRQRRAQRWVPLTVGILFRSLRRATA